MTQNDDCFTWLIKAVGTLVMFVPVSIGFAFAWIGIALVGIIIFVFFTVAALFMDPARWARNNFRANIPENERTIHRLRKASMIIILIFEIMAEIKHDELRAALLYSQEPRDDENGRPVPTAHAVPART